MRLIQFLHLRPILGSVLAMLITLVAHQGWKSTANGTTSRGALDLACHFGTACAVTLPVLPNTQDQRKFGAVAVGSAIAIDIDHIVAARSLEMNRWMSMPSRPPTHSLLTLIAMAWTVERLAPGRRLWLAVMLGVGSHLLRDLATGGAPLWHPRRVITWPVPTVALFLLILPLLGWKIASLPIRPRGKPVLPWRSSLS